MSEVHWGFTGTQEGMTGFQAAEVRKLLEVGKPHVVHHGDCVGSDEQFDGIARSLGIRVDIHPPSDPKKRAYADKVGVGLYPETKGIVKEEKAYLDRNKDIVDASSFLIATPKTIQEELRSGTWSTVRYARRQGVEVMVVVPD